MKIPNKLKRPIKIFRTQSRIVVGGPALHTILLSKAFNNYKFETVLVGGVNKETEKSLFDSARAQNITCHIIPEMAREIHFYDDIISFIKLYRLIKQEKPLIFHSHTSKAGAIGRVAAYWAGVPYIFHTFHGHVFSGYFNKIKTNIFVWLERLLAKITTYIIAISESQKYDIVVKYRIAPNKKVKNIPLGFDWKPFLKSSKNNDLRRKYKIPTTKKLIGIIGRIVPIKDHFLFVEIAERLINLEPEKYHFILIGDGDLRKVLETKIKNKNIQQSFTFTGWLDLNKSIYQNLDVLLLTSKNEGTPVTVIEALVSGVPVLATAVGGVRDIMKMYNLNYMIMGRDPELFVNKILEIMQTKGKVPKYVSQKIMEFYSSTRLISDIEKLYQSTMK